MGFSDLGCYGSEIPTPNIDALANEGIRFTQFYNTGRCCPSRASLMTGIYAHMVGMGRMNSKNFGTPGYTGRLNDTTYTLAEALKTEGYQTYMVGKWHLTPTDSVIAKNQDGSWPFQRGFDEFYGSMEGAKDYFRPSYLYRNQSPLTTGDNYFYTHAISDSAATFITNHTGPSPLFLYAAFYAPHFPLHAPKATIQKYRGKYLEGWNKLRNTRLQKQKALGIISETTNLPPSDSKVLNWEELSPEKQDEMDWRMAIYAAQIEELDKGIGKIIQALKNANQYENTFIVFLSDNGAVGTSLYGRGKKENLNQSGPYTSYGKGWGQASNTPYQKYKAFTHEGGIIAPLIIRYEKWLTAGTINRQPVHIIDLMPTLLELADVNLPKRKNGITVKEVDGESFLSALKTPNESNKNRPLFWEHLGRRAVRLKSWKLVTTNESGPWELYNLHQDPTEIENLAEKHPEKVKELNRLWNNWANTHQVLPLDKRD